MIRKILFLSLSSLIITGLIFFARGKKALLGGLDGYLAKSSKTNLDWNVGSLEEKVSDQDQVVITAKPKLFSPLGNEIELTLTTHSVDLNFDLREKSVLVSGSETLQPMVWSGGRGGHHLSGVLKFPPFKNQPSSIKLLINDPLLTQERVLQWTF